MTRAKSGMPALDGLRALHAHERGDHDTESDPGCATCLEVIAAGDSLSRARCAFCLREAPDHLFGCVRTGARP